MKNLLIAISFFVSGIVYANEMPKYLKGATVTVTLKDGKTYTYKSEDMAVVKRNNIDINAAALAEHKQIKRQIKEKKIVKNRKNRVYVLGGYGQTGNMDVSTNGQTYEVKHDMGAVGGIGFQRKVNEKFNLGIQVQTNDTTSISAGFDF